MVSQGQLNEDILKEISRTQSVETFNFLGVLSVALDSLTRNMLSTQLLNLMENDVDFTMVSWISELEKVNSRYQRSLDSFKFLSQTLPVFSGPLLFVTFEKEKKFFRCSIYILEDFKGQVTARAHIDFVPDIKKHVRNAASHLHELLREQYGLSTSRKKERSVFKLKKPVVGGVLAYNDRVVKNDSIQKIYSGQTLILDAESEPYFIRSNKFRYILHPSSAYTFYSPSIIEVRQGHLGSIQTEFQSKLITGSMICEISSAIADIEFSEGTTVVRVYAGSVNSRPVNETEEFTKISGKQSARTNGYQLKTGELTDSAFSERLQVFKPLLNSRIVAHFKSSRKILDIIPSSNIDFFQADVRDPMNYFMASELNDLGIPMEALSFEGESWDPDKKLFKSGVNETGCYLCSPNRSDLD